MSTNNDEHISENFINLCKRRTNHKFLGRRFGTLSNESKSEIFQLEMSMCLEKKYMKCLQHVRDLNQKKQTDPISSIDVCEPLIHEYIGTCILEPKVPVVRTNGTH